MTFGQIIKELLEDNDISQKKMAHDLNIGATTLGNYIHDLREPDFQTLKSIAAYFNVSADYLLDNRTTATANHEEDRLLHLYRSLPEDYRVLLIEMGKVLKHSDIQRHVS